MGGRILTICCPDLIFSVAIHGANLTNRACERDATLAITAMEETKFYHVFLFRPERKYSLVIYLAYLLLAGSWAHKRRYGVYP